MVEKEELLMGEKIIHWICPEHGEFELVSKEWSDKMIRLHSKLQNLG
jgi:hypothetical protein